MVVRTVPVSGLQGDELKGFSRTVAEIEWLLVILVLLYQVFRGREDETAGPVYLGLSLFSVCVIGFRYFNFYRGGNLWKLAVETWMMIVFITWVIYYTGRLESPLVNLYLLVIITSALTLGKLATLLETGLIATCYFFLGYARNLESFLTLAFAADFMTQIAPMLLVAYVTTLLAEDIRAALARIKHLSEIDELTRIYNIRAFTLILDHTLAYAARYARPCSILMIDSDNLKAVNDAYGHEAGNRLLQLTVGCIRETLRTSDIVARYGGDEFVLLLPETPAAGALEVAERVRARVAATPLDAGGKQVPTSVSIGIATYPAHGNRLIDKADQALYASKQQGRNRVTVYCG